jgi:cystathionine beta-lyase
VDHLDLHALTPTQLRARRTLKWTAYPPEVLPMWVAEMDYPSAAPVTAAVRRAADVESFGYPAPGPVGELAQALAEWQQRTHGWAVDPADIHVVADVMKGVALAIGHFTGPTDPVVIPSPVYMPFFDVVAITGRPQVRVPMVWDAAAGAHDGRWGFDLAGIDAALAAGARTVLISSPHNPLGRVFTRAELTALAEVVERHGARVVSDEIHAPLVFDRPHTPYATVSPAAAAHTITVVSASKAWNTPGLKCAQVITCPADRQRWKAIPFWETVGVSTLGIEAGIAAYREGGEWLGRVVATLAAHRSLVAEAVDGMPGVRTVANEGTYLQWLDFEGLALDVEPATWLLEDAKVALSPGPPFGAQQHRYARLNFATSGPLLAEGLARIARAVAKRAR